jgi:ribosomal protein S18 acetylase RimI-like enzyme
VNRTQTDRAPGHSNATIQRLDSVDLAALTGFFAGLSLRTRFQRFFAPVTPTLAALRRLSGGAGHADVLVAIQDGVIIGHAMATDRTGPEGDMMTDFGVVVADAWQGQGVGSALVRALIARAQARGVTSMTMDVLHSNRQVLAMIASHWTTARTDRSADCVTVHVRLPPHQPERPHPAPGSRLPATTRRPATTRQPARPATQRSRALTG